ncbi:MAG: hypothetical protein JWN75_1120 [Candidatus Saccharibacteria bacterium]|nr:hypothetical protein [Candidatus Saccharibacteria bacterium]
MLVSDLISNISDALRGLDDDAPTTGSSDHTYWLRVANRKLRELYTDVKQQWSFATYVADVPTIPVLATDTDVIPISVPDWLTYAVAADIAFNDTTYEDKFSDLTGKANDLYLQMVTNNRRPTTQPRTISYSITPIAGVE